MLSQQTLDKLHAIALLKLIGAPNCTILGLITGFVLGTSLAGAGSGILFTIAFAGCGYLAPDVVVLGGGLVEEMPELFVESVRGAANERVMSSFVGSFKVVVAKLGDDAAVMGAAAWAQKTASSLAHAAV